MKRFVKLLAGVLCAVMLATPVSAVTPVAYTMSEFLKEEAKRLKDQPVEVHYTVTYYKDAEHMEAYADISAVPSGEYVYYELACDKGYYVKWINIDADHMDGEKILFGKHAPAEPAVNCVRAGDVNSDHAVNLSDVVLLMRFMTVEYYDYSEEMISADYNGDGVFNILDCVALMKYIAKWDIELAGECAAEPTIYCRIALEEEVRARTVFDRGIQFYNTNVIESTNDLEAYIAKFGEFYSMNDMRDNTAMNNNFYADDLREAYNEEYFTDNRLVIFDFSYDANGCRGKVYAENDDNTLRFAVDIARGNGVLSGIYVVYHHMLTVPRDSGIDLDAGIGVYTRDYNTVGARYLQNIVDIEVDADYINNDGIIEYIKHIR